MEERYIASMILSGAGDALGFKNGDWEFCHSGESIHAELHDLGGIENILVSLPKWRVSDDTVMHIATAEALVSLGFDIDRNLLYERLVTKYKECMHDMTLRSPGATCTQSAFQLKAGIVKGHHIPFNKRGGGCGAAMRAMCIGLRYPRPNNLDDLIAVSIESGRMTHNHPTGFLGSLAAALFTSYAIQEKPVHEWGASLINVLSQALEYVVSEGRDVEDNRANWQYFTEKWSAYLLQRKISDGKSKPDFPANFGIKERDICYKRWSFGGWGGASGHDSVMIAYDALLGAGDSWSELCDRAVFHGGDSDSTGAIAAAWFGAMYGFHGVPESNFKKLEYRKRLTKLGQRLNEFANRKNKLVYQMSNETEDAIVSIVSKAPDVPVLPNPSD